MNTVSSTAGTLKFAVGTANIFGTATGLNVASTYRLPSNGGLSVLVSTPKLTGPFVLPAASADAGLGWDQFSTIAAYGNVIAGGATSGPSALEVANHEITGTPQTIRPNDPVCDQATNCTSNPVEVANTTSFGQAGGVFSNGIQPANETNNGVPQTYEPYPVPIYDTSTDAFLPWGGPPAFDRDGKGMGVRDGLNDVANVLGITEGITTFEGVAPVAGTYTLAMTIPTGIGATTGNVSLGTVTSTATLANVVPLPTIITPAAVTEDGTGGVSVPVVLPAGVTEAFVNLVDYGPSGIGDPEANCSSASGIGTELAPVYYTAVVHASGTVTFGDKMGPNLLNGKNGFSAAPTLCTAAANQTALADPTQTGDIYTIEIVGVDYPAYEANVLFPSVSPTIVGAGGQADITISAPLMYTYTGGASAGAPYSKARVSAKAHRTIHRTK